MAILVETSKKFEQMKNPAWEALSGTPNRWMLYSGNKIRLVPAFDGSTTCGIGYVQMPTLFTGGDTSATVDVRVPPTHQEFLKYAAAYYLLNMRGERQFVELADKFLDEFHKRIGV